MKDKTEILLFRQIREGNKEAFAKMFTMYYESVARFIFRYVKDGDTAEEIAQDLFIHFWENAPRLNITASVKAYLFTSARNFSFNHLKKNKIREKYHELANADTETVALVEEVKSTDNQFLILLKQSLDTLPEKCREIFELSKFEGLSYEEIADFLQISKKTVENQLAIALRKIRAWMAPYKQELFE